MREARSRPLALLLAVLLVTAMLPVAPAGAVETALIQQLTTNDANDWSADISDDRVVWSGQGGSDGGTDYEIFTWTPGAGVQQIVANGLDDTGPQTSDERVVWQQGWSIWTWLPAHPIQRLDPAASTTYSASPRVSGYRVVWRGQGGSDGGTDNEIFTWTPGGGVQQITENLTEDTAPEVSGDRLAWLGVGGVDGGTDAEIFTWTPSYGKGQLYWNSIQESDLRVSGDRLVWKSPGGSDGGTDTEIFTWAPGGPVQQITDNATADDAPQVSGDRVVWRGRGGADGGTDYEIFTWTPGGGVQQLTTSATDTWDPVVSGSRVAWFSAGGADGGTDYEIFAWTPGGGVQQLTSDSADDRRPRVSGNRVVWYATGGSDGGTDYEIFLATFVQSGPDRGVYVSADAPAPSELSLTFSVRAGTTPEGGSVADNAIDFGMMEPNVAKTGSHFLEVFTNAPNGYNVAALEDMPLSSGAHQIPDVMGDDDSITESVAGPWVSATTLGFGYTLANSTGTPASFTSGFKQFADLSASETPQDIMTNASATAKDAVELTYKLNVGPAQAQGTYTNTVTYIATGNL